MERIAWWLVIIGALNWLIIGLFQTDVVTNLFGGQDAWLSRAAYTLFGLAGVYLLPQLFGVKDGPKKG